MSIVFSRKTGWVLSHEAFSSEIYSVIEGSPSQKLNSALFEINQPYKRRKNDGKVDLDTEVEHVKDLYCKLLREISELGSNEQTTDNKEALEKAQEVHEISGRESISETQGSNLGPAVVKSINGSEFVFPENCKFFCRKVEEISNYVEEKFDLILLDPPWWNKYIRRKRKRSSDGYSMLYNQDLKNIPLENLLQSDGLAVIWCTNSKQHLDMLIKEILPKWNLEFVGKWYWVKVTKSFEPVCEFSKPPGKQPFEQIILACGRDRRERKPDCDKLVLSVPSAVHSHKPPLTRLLEPFLPENPKCLEVFARYLLPGWTSYGNEVLRLQHKCLYTDR